MSIRSIGCWLLAFCVAAAIQAQDADLIHPVSKLVHGSTFSLQSPLRWMRMASRNDYAQMFRGQELFASVRSPWRYQLLIA